MRRIDYKGEEYLIHTRSGMRVVDAMMERGIPIDCDPKGDMTGEGCRVKWPKDTQFLLTAPTERERRVLGDQVDKGFRLIYDAIFK